MADRLRLAGPVDQEGKWELLSGADLVVLPSYSESFGMAALEAMAVARPVAVTPEVGLAEIVREADSGIVVDGAPEKLGLAIDRLLLLFLYLEHDLRCHIACPLTMVLVLPLLDHV